MSNLNTSGFEILNDIYSKEEIFDILALLQKLGIEKKFGIREFLHNKPELLKLLLNKNLSELVNTRLPNAFIVKSIYFDKPINSNWVVNWHQDLTINVTRKCNDVGFLNWRVQPERTVVQPPVEFLNNIVTIRIHLDNCTKTNGALRVIRGSHKNGVIPNHELTKIDLSNAEYCEVELGGVAIMKPLLVHSSRRVSNNNNRRVIHVEFSNLELPKSIEWKERIEIGERLVSGK